jgi:hypothetical protein
MFDGGGSAETFCYELNVVVDRPRSRKFASAQKYEPHAVEA